MSEHTIPDAFFRALTADEEVEFRQWARDNWRPGDPVEPAWHPVVRDECRILLDEARRSGVFDYEDNNERSRA